MVDGVVRKNRTVATKVVLALLVGWHGWLYGKGFDYAE